MSSDKEEEKSLKKRLKSRLSTQVKGKRLSAVLSKSVGGGSSEKKHSTTQATDSDLVSPRGTISAPNSEKRFSIVLERNSSQSSGLSSPRGSHINTNNSNNSPTNSSNNGVNKTEENQLKNNPRLSRLLTNSVSINDTGAGNTASVGGGGLELLSEEEHNKLFELYKKFSNGNKQLLAVTRAMVEKILSGQKEKGPKIEIVITQLQLTREELQIINNKFAELTRNSQKLYNHIKTLEILEFSTEIAHYTSLIATAIKTIALEYKDDDALYKPTFTSITTARDSIEELIAFMKGIVDKIDENWINNMTMHCKNCSLLIESLLATRSAGKLITFGRRLEVEAASRVVISSLFIIGSYFILPFLKSVPFSLFIFIRFFCHSIFPFLHFFSTCLFFHEEKII